MASAVRRSQAERSNATRAKILNATVQCLVEIGYSRTTTAEVLARADVGRGTLLHHFPAKVDLLVAAVHHVARRRLDDLAVDLSAVPPNASQTDALLDVLWRHLSAPIFWAALELWVAARTESELRGALQPVEKEVFGVMHDSARALLERAAPDDARVPTVIEFSYALLTGFAMTGIVSGDVAHSQLLLRRWKRAVEVLLARRPAESLVESSRPTPRTPRTAPG